MRLENVNIILGIGLLFSSFTSSELEDIFPDYLAKLESAKEEYPSSTGTSSYSSSPQTDKVETVPNVIPAQEIPLKSENTNQNLMIVVNSESNPAVESSKGSYGSGEESERMKNATVKNIYDRPTEVNGIGIDDEPEVGFLPLILHYMTTFEETEEEKLPLGEGETQSEYPVMKNNTLIAFLTTTIANAANTTTGSPFSLLLSSTQPTTQPSTSTTAIPETTKTIEDDDEAEDDTNDDEESSTPSYTSHDEEVSTPSDYEVNHSKDEPESETQEGKAESKSPNLHFVNSLVENTPILIKLSNKKNDILRMTITKGNVTETAEIPTKDARKVKEDHADSEDRDDDSKEPESDREDEGEEVEGEKKRQDEETDDRISENEDPNEKDSEKVDGDEDQDDDSKEGAYLSFNNTKEVQSDQQSQASVYTPVLEDAPTSDVNKLQEILRSYFMEPRHWPFNVSNTWHLKLLKEFKSYGLKTFVQENTDRDKFWFYDEHKRDTELSKYPIINVIGMLPGKNRGQSKDGILIVGAHYDTRANSPGIDDNGSGMAVLMETARVLAKSKYTLENTIFFVAFDRKELGFGGSGLFVLEYLIPAELLVKRGYLQGVFIVDTVLNYDNRPRSQSIPKSVKEYSPEATKTIQRNKNRGDFLAVISRTTIDDRLSKTFMDNWNRLNDTKYSILEMQIDGTGNVERDEIFYKGYYFFASDHIYFWYHDSHEFNGTLPAIRLFDTGIERGRMRKCHHRACDNASFINEDNLRFLKKTTDALILSLIDLGQGTTMVPMSSDEERRYPWNYFMYIGSAILSGTAFLATTISKLDSVR